MKTPLTYGAHRILHDLFSKGAMFKGALSREKLPELEVRGFVATNANNLVYLTPTGQQYAIESFIGEHSKVSQGLCGNTIEQETLSAVLVHFLPTTNLDKASDNAVKLASAVKASFAELDRPTGGVVSGEYAPLRIFGEIGDPITIPASTIKPGADGEGKQDSTITVKINVDASEAMKSLDELGSMAKKIDAIVAEALQQNGSIFRAINQRERNAASRDDLSVRVRALENCVCSQGNAIADLGVRITKFAL